MEQMKFCYACGAPLTTEFKGLAENYCKHCTDEGGKVKSRQEIQAGLAEWFKMWQPNIDDRIALERASHYMKAMPHWVDESQNKQAEATRKTARLTCIVERVAP